MAGNITVVVSVDTKISTNFPKGNEMSFSRVIADRRAAARRRIGEARTNRALNKAISSAATPGMRDELIMVGQRNRDLR